VQFVEMVDVVTYGRVAVNADNVLTFASFCLKSLAHSAAHVEDRFGVIGHGAEHVPPIAANWVARLY
jgi:hypothetical protein